MGARGDRRRNPPRRQSGSPRPRHHRGGGRQGLHPDAELAPRDIVARGVFAEIAAGRGAFLDASRSIGAAFAERFPTVYASCMAAGIDPARQPIPVAPAARYHMGGVLVDAVGRASLDGLWAAGEVASTGAHGANRLASNSLLEAVVFAARIAEDIAGLVSRKGTGGTSGQVPPSEWPQMSQSSEGELRKLMTANVGVIRNEAGLGYALREIARIEREATTSDLRNMATAALLVAAGAYRPRESRGGHYRSDYPHADPQARRTFMTLDDARTVADDAIGTPLDRRQTDVAPVR